MDELVAQDIQPVKQDAHMRGEYDFSEEKLRDTLDILPPKKAA